MAFLLLSLRRLVCEDKEDEDDVVGVELAGELS
jgi:hypothetical protein